MGRTPRNPDPITPGDRIGLAVFVLFYLMLTAAVVLARREIPGL